MNTQQNILEFKTETKSCLKCGEIKPIQQFYHNVGKGKIGLSDNCQSCKSENKKNTWVQKKLEREKSYVPPATKVCSRCKIDKPISAFARASWRLIGTTPDCKDCRNARYKDPRGGDMKSRPDRVLKKYGVTYDYVVQILAKQFGCCANLGCSKEITLDVKGTTANRAVIDHDHATGKFRALLCSDCNTTLGFLETRKNKIPGLMDYINKHKE